MGIGLHRFVLVTLWDCFHLAVDSRRRPAEGFHIQRRQLMMNYPAPEDLCQDCIQHV